ncbi:MgtC/SapB family protein [Pararhodobacter oceanensis]|uniref:MgtC/SapB family protein n=1 Tax=Pararhodobacter oceanensis TaxID=2172121 RepID=UPI003A8E8ED0
MWQDIWTSILGEFSDIPDLHTFVTVGMRLFFAALLGGLLGYEREVKHHNAGLRTHMLVAVGSAAFVAGSLQAGIEVKDLSRVIQGVVQGIGFLGAGAIIVRKSTQTVQGLTTAANIWATAGIGVLAGLGMIATAVLATVLLLAILAVIPFIIKPVKPIPADKREKEETEPK